MKKYKPYEVQGKWYCSRCGHTHIEEIKHLNENARPRCEKCNVYKYIVAILVPEEPIKPGE